MPPLAAFAVLHLINASNASTALWMATHQGRHSNRDKAIPRSDPRSSCRAQPRRLAGWVRSIPLLGASFTPHVRLIMVRQSCLAQAIGLCQETLSWLCRHLLRALWDRTGSLICSPLPELRTSLTAPMSIICTLDPWAKGFYVVVGSLRL